MKIFLVFLIGVVVGVILITIIPNIIEISVPFVELSQISYKYDALAVILSALTATLTALAIAIALLAFFGYNKIQEDAKNTAKVEASGEIKKQFKDMDDRLIALEKEKIDPQLETKMPNRKTEK